MYLFSEKSPGITKTLIYACGPCGGPTSAKPSWLSLSLRCCCHDQPSLVGDPSVKVSIRSHYSVRAQKHSSKTKNDVLLMR